MTAAVTVELQVSNTAVSTANIASTTACPAHGSIKRTDPSPRRKTLLRTLHSPIGTKNHRLGSPGLFGQFPWSELCPRDPANGLIATEPLQPMTVKRMQWLRKF